MENQPVPTEANRYVGFTPEEVKALLAWLPTYDEGSLITWERLMASVRRKLIAVDIAR